MRTASKRSSILLFNLRVREGIMNVAKTTTKPDSNNTRPRTACLCCNLLVTSFCSASSLCTRVCTGQQKWRTHKAMMRDCTNGAGTNLFRVSARNAQSCFRIFLCTKNMVFNFRFGVEILCKCNQRPPFTMERR